MTDEHKRVVVCIGSNRSKQDVVRCKHWVCSLLNFSKSSSIYMTPAVGNPNGSPYHNAVIVGETIMELKDLNARFKEYELLLGRTEMARKADIVPIDIDIVIFNDSVIRNWDYRQNFFLTGYSQIIEN